ncbi:hypothetical protein H2204_001907 [Knufia peltigerae]|uniref:Uncharacterized protein n=1 Tax=Knufia peltigerae TaxID=1002370 RepID=A0AA38YDR9_9EURO|nr:hypothetical protein H2204_001907 [Knufia peltigerae]
MPLARRTSWYRFTSDTVHGNDCLKKPIKPAKFATLEDYLNKPLPLEDHLDKPLPPTPNQSVDLWCATNKNGETVFEAADAGAQDTVKSVYEQARCDMPIGMSVQSPNGDADLQHRPVEGKYPVFRRTLAVAEHETDKVPTYQSLRNLRDSEELPDYALHGPCELLTKQATPKKRTVLSPKSPKAKLRSSELVFRDKPVVPYGSQCPAKYVTSDVDIFELYVIRAKIKSKKRKVCEPIDTKSFIGFSDSNVFACSPVPFKKLRTDRQDDIDVEVDGTIASMDLLPPLAPVPAQTPVVHAKSPSLLLPIFGPRSPSAKSTDEYFPIFADFALEFSEVPTIVAGQAASAPAQDFSNVPKAAPFIPALALPPGLLPPSPVHGSFDLVDTEPISPTIAFSQLPVGTSGPLTPASVEEHSIVFKTEPLSPVILPDIPSATPELSSPSSTETSGTVQTGPPSPSTVFPDSQLESEVARLRGWPGQFESYEVGHINRRADRANPPEIQTFGNPDHPNGEFTHVNFFVDPIAHRDYTSEHLKSVRVRKVAFSHADFETDNALEVEVRTAAQEELRRRAYRECAMARLQGVSVGHHRYYEGDMTIAQYVDRKMCICWEDCWCQKLCTIYADVKCPCRRFIRLGTGPAGGASVEVEDLDDEMALAIWESNNVKF